MHDQVTHANDGESGPTEPDASSQTAERRVRPIPENLTGQLIATLPASTRRMIEEVGKLGSMFAVSKHVTSALAPARVPSLLFDPALESAISAAREASSMMGPQGFNSIFGSIPTPSILTDPTLASTISKAFELSTLSSGVTEMLRGTSMFDTKELGLAGMVFPTSVFAPLQSIISDQLASFKGFTVVPESLLGDLSWISELTKGLKLGKPHLPSNWRQVEIEPDDLEDEVRGILEEGIPLAWVPSARVIELLLAAPDSSTRRRVISSNHKGILTGCERLVSRLPQKRALLYGDMIRKAINALRDGHVEAAQSLATNVLDTILTQHSRDALKVSLGAVKNASSYERFRKQGWRLALAIHPVTTVMNGSYTVGDRPAGYRRNATAHAITRHQYNRINAVLAIMNATSVLTCFVRDTPAFD